MENEILRCVDLKDFKRWEIPFLCEIWNWEGDESVLPGKWAHIVNEAYGTDYKSSFFRLIAE